MTKNLIFSVIFSLFLLSCAGNSILESTIPDDTGKSEKQKSMERKLEKRDVRLPADSPLLKGEGIFDTEFLILVEVVILLQSIQYYLIQP